MGYTGEKKREYQLQWLAKRRNAWIDTKGGKCNYCGSTEELHVDHIDPATKSVDPANIWSRSAEFREAELAKCQVLCRSCHEAKTAQEFAIDHPHGDRLRYDKGCRCVECKDAKRLATQQDRLRWGGRKAPATTT